MVDTEESYVGRPMVVGICHSLTGHTAVVVVVYEAVSCYTSSFVLCRQLSEVNLTLAL